MFASSKVTQERWLLNWMERILACESSPSPPETHRRCRGHERRTADGILHALGHFRWWNRRGIRWLIEVKKVHCKNWWKGFSGCSLAGHFGEKKKTQEKRTQFWQTRSHAIILHDSVPPGCVEKVVSLGGDKIWYQKIPTSRPAQKIVLKNAWQVEQGKLSNSEKSCAGRISLHIWSPCSTSSTKCSTWRSRKKDQDSRLGANGQNGIPNGMCDSPLD